MNKSFAQDALKMCNTWGKFSSGVILIFLVGFMIYFLKDLNDYNTVTGSVKSVNKDDCVNKQKIVQDRRGSHVEAYTDCFLTIDYTINGEKITHDLHTEDIEHSVGEPIDIDYNKNNAKMIRPHDAKNKFILYILIFFTIITLVTLYLRMFHFDNKYVKTFVGITCIQDFFNFF
jgi:hypothetical protein